MNGITHKQAQRYIRADLDGLLTDAQRLELKTHLDSCPACRLESESFSTLRARLQTEFHARWDDNDGPSKHVMANIHSQTRRIMMQKRIDLVFNVLGGALALFVLGFILISMIAQFQKVHTTPATDSTSALTPQPTFTIGTDKKNGDWIAFIGTKTNPSSDSTDQLSTDDVYLIHPDGIGLINLTNNAEPASNHLDDLQWSPNGKYLAFVQIHGGTEILGANQEGSYVITDVHFNPDDNSPFDVYSWSPRGERIAFVDNRSGNYDIYTVYADGRNNPQLTQLTNDPAQDVGFVWSPDGNQIAYERLDGDTLSVYTMNADGSNQRELAHGAGKVKLRWSKYGAVLYASASTESDWLACDACVAKPGIYRIGMDGQGVNQIHYEQNVDKVDGWYLYDTPQNTLYILRIKHSAFLAFSGTWLFADGNSVHEIGEMDPHQTCKTTTGNILDEHPSSNERFSIVSDFCAGGFDLYLADHETTTPEKKLTHLLRLPLVTYGEGDDGAYLPISWSPDGRWLIYTSGSVYLLNVEKAMQESDTKPSILIQPQILAETSGLPTVSPVNLLVSSSSLAWQPAPDDVTIEQKPTPKPTQTFSLTVQEAEALAGFDVLVPSYLPEGYTFQGAAYDPQYQIVTLQYISLPEDSMRRSTISISQKLGEFPDLSKERELGLPSHATPVPVENVMGKFTHGVWVYDSPDATTPRWEGDNDYYSLSWQKDGMSFAVDFLGGVTTPPIQLNELTAIAKSLKSVETLPIATDKSNGEWIAFIGTKTNSSSNPTDQLSTDDVYLIHPDGTGLTNLTNNAEPAGNHLEGLQWSPNGKYLAFVQIRGDTEILGANQEGSYAITNVHFNSGTMAPFDVYSWSPDGIRIAFVDNRSGNYDIYTVFADGRNDPQLAQLTNDPAQEVGFVWSPDGSQIAYEKLDGNNLSIYIMNADGSNQREVAHGTGKVRLQWSKYGAVLYAMANTNADLLACDTCVAKPAIYRIGLDGQGVSQVHYEQDATGWYLYDTPHNTLYFMRAIHSSFLGMTGDWMYLNDNSVHDIGEFDPHQTCKTTTGNILNEYISPNERFSIISDFCAGGFDLYLADREAATPEKKLTHLLRLPLSTLGEGGDSAYLPIRWSPDGRWLIYASGSVYLLNVEKAIQESDTKPSILVQPQIFVETSGLPTVTPVNLLVSSSSATWQP